MQNQNTIYFTLGVLLSLISVGSTDMAKQFYKPEILREAIIFFPENTHHNKSPGRLPHTPDGLPRVFLILQYIFR